MKFNRILKISFYNFYLVFNCLYCLSIQIIIKSSWNFYLLSESWIWDLMTKLFSMGSTSLFYKFILLLTRYTCWKRSTQATITLKGQATLSAMTYIVNDDTSLKKNYTNFDTPFEHRDRHPYFINLYYFWLGTLAEKGQHKQL